MPKAFALIVLRQRAEFLAVAAHGKKWVTPGLIVQRGPMVDPLRASIRYGLTASSKIGNAVTRNRARRRLRALANAILPGHGAAGYDYVLIARNGTTVTRGYEDLKKDLLWALRRLGSDDAKAK